MSLYFPTGEEGSRHQIFPGVSIRTLPARQMMLSLVTMEPNSTVKAHSHPHEQVGILVSGSAIFIIGDEKKEVAPGDMYRIPGGVVHEVHSLGEGAVAMDVFHPIREDYL